MVHTDRVEFSQPLESRVMHTDRVESSQILESLVVHTDRVESSQIARVPIGFRYSLNSAQVNNSTAMENCDMLVLRKKGVAS